MSPILHPLGPVPMTMASLGLETMSLGIQPNLLPELPGHLLTVHLVLAPRSELLHVLLALVDIPLLVSDNQPPVIALTVLPALFLTLSTWYEPLTASSENKMLFLTSPRLLLSAKISWTLSLKVLTRCSRIFRFFQTILEDQRSIDCWNDMMLGDFFYNNSRWFLGSQESILTQKLALPFSLIFFN